MLGLGVALVGLGDEVYFWLNVSGLKSLLNNTSRTARPLLKTSVSLRLGFALSHVRRRRVSLDLLPNCVSISRFSSRPIEPNVSTLLGLGIQYSNASNESLGSYVSSSIYVPSEGLELPTTNTNNRHLELQCSSILDLLKMASNQNEQPSGRKDMPVNTSVDDDCLEIDESVSFDENSCDNMSLCSNSSDICVVFDTKVQQSKTVVEILIDDDENEVISAQSSQISCAAEDFIPLQRHPSTAKPTTTQTRQNNRRDDNRSENGTDTGHIAAQFLMAGPISQEEVEKKREELELVRTWEYTNLGATMVAEGQLNNPHNQIFTVMSYNVLAQSLLESHLYLYQTHDQRALAWEHRSQVLFKEIKMANPDILCLQEVQTSHMDSFFKAIKELGYGVVHKQRTGGKGDGVAIYYKDSMFALQDSTTVEFYQPGVPILNRDNVGVVVKLKIKNDRQGRCVVVATTHLLFNPRRHDVKLAQIQILLAEVERFSYGGLNWNGDPLYCPSIITGDMNFQPYTGVYELLTTGVLKFEGLSSQSLTYTEHGRMLDSQLIPHHLEITDTCQHFSIASQRPNVLTFEAEQETIKLFSSEKVPRGKGRKKPERYHSFDEYMKEMVRRGCVNNFTPNPNLVASPPSPPSSALHERWGTGQLSHKLNLRSVYNHGHAGTERVEVTTNQGDWITVDYIFYSCKFNNGLQKVIEGDLKLVSRLRLPREYQAKKIGPIPNPAIPSDHYPLAAVFLLK